MYFMLLYCFKFSIDPHTSGLFPETNSPDYAVLNGFIFNPFVTTFFIVERCLPSLLYGCHDRERERGSGSPSSLPYGQGEDSCLV